MIIWNRKPLKTQNRSNCQSSMDLDRAFQQLPDAGLLGLAGGLLKAHWNHWEVCSNICLQAITKRLKGQVSRRGSPKDSEAGCPNSWSSCLPCLLSSSRLAHDKATRTRKLWLQGIRPSRETLLQPVRLPAMPPWTSEMLASHSIAKHDYTMSKAYLLRPNMLHHA